VFALLPECRLAEWEAQSYATLHFAPPRVPALGAAIDALLRRLHALGDYAVDGSVERIVGCGQA